MNIETLFEVIRKKGLRLTKTRRAVLELFVTTHAPLSVPHILARLERQALTVNKTTVYRELEALEKIGIVKGIQLQDRKQYFELATRDHHHHFVCTLCNAIMDVKINEAGIMARAEQLGRKLGFHITTHAVEFYGQCAPCLSNFSSRQSA